MHLVQRHTSEAVAHTEILFLIREGPGAVAVVDDGPHVGGAVTAQSAVASHSHVGAVVVVSAVGGRKGLPIGRVVDDHPVAVRDGGVRVRRGLRIGGLARVKGPGLVELEGINRRVAAHAEAGEVAAIEFQILGLSRELGIGALHEEAAVRLLQFKEGILSLLLHQADVGAVQIQVAFGALEGIAAICVYCDLELSRTVGDIQRSIGCFSIQGDQFVLRIAAAAGVSIALAAHNFAAGGVVKDHRIPLRLRRGLGLHRLAIQLVEGKVAGISGGTFGDRAILIGPEFIPRALIAGQGNGILAGPLELECSVGKDHAPVVIALDYSVFISAFRRHCDAVCIGEHGRISVHGDRPDQVGGRAGDDIPFRRHLRGGEPGSVQCAHRISGVHHHHILSRGELVLRRNLLVRPRLPGGESRARDQAQEHSQCQQGRQGFP